MAPRKKAALSGLNLALLATVAAATLADNFVYVSDADAAPFLSHVPPLFEQNPSMKDTNGATATRTTTEGTAYSAANPADASPAPAASAPAVKPVFARARVALPEIKRGGGVGTSTYPFDQLEAPDANGLQDSFFIPATEDRPEPAKALASTVSSATRRYLKPVIGANGQPEIENVAAKPAKGNPGEEGYEAAVPAGTRIKQAPERKFVIRAIEDGAPWGDQHKGVKGAAVFREK